MEAMKVTLMEINATVKGMLGHENHCVRVAGKRIKPYIPELGQIQADMDIGVDLREAGFCLFNTVTGNWVDGSSLAILTTVASHSVEDAIIASTIRDRNEVSIDDVRMLQDLVVSCRSLQDELASRVLREVA
jgi:hypothetical protein